MGEENLLHLRTCVGVLRIDLGSNFEAHTMRKATEILTPPEEYYSARLSLSSTRARRLPLTECT